MAPDSDYEYQIPFGSLPLLFDTTLDSIPSTIPYLQVSQSSIKDWQAKLPLAHAGRLNIGIACSGNINFDIKRGNTRPISLALLQEAFPNDNLFLIQKDLRENDLETLSNHPAIHYLGDYLNNFEDTAAVVENMDLIISIDTSLAHLAGTLGKQVFILLPWASDWRWFLDREDSPWYPSAKLYRQKSFGDWPTVLVQLKKDVAALIKS
ncbi:hypothetical protein [Polynucleobacter sp. UB-Piko-W3]|uniref:hypothetical protein n=1 Tax=Polynucleobacter sp. UB-Piko-W3 TaxID=1819735 RepID=UPI001C0B09D3|nr:hypothetical protein [Polynucleobacter sp. UB-Piko-W3]MBU3555824.1 hypothetical protein [Polynucleobacter sp. UB-Piko-W3]